MFDSHVNGNPYEIIVPLPLKNMHQREGENKLVNQVLVFHIHSDRIFVIKFNDKVQVVFLVCVKMRSKSITKLMALALLMLRYMACYSLL